MKKRYISLLVLFLFVALVQCSMESKQEDHAKMAGVCLSNPSLQGGLE